MSGCFHPDHDACGVGFIAQLDGAASHEIVERAIEALRRLSHRGGVDADSRSGDGAGLLTIIPKAFMRREAYEAGIDLPERFGLGMVFFPPGEQQAARLCVESHARKHCLTFLGWREVPVDPTVLGPRSLETVPRIQQFFLGPGTESACFDAQLFRFRKHAEAGVPAGTYFCSVSSHTLVYKGLLTPEQLPGFYPDLRDPEFSSPFAIFHQRYSTNTQPSWSLAQPFRYVAHNGEINTITANRRWLHARQVELKRELQLDARAQLLEQNVSDSASLDNGLEVLLRRGASLPEAIASMVPPAWENASAINRERRFFEESSYRQEPWDGPAALVFSDGRFVGARLDRNGLRPLRYTITADGLLVAGSEAGIADLQDKDVVERQRLGPGEMLVLDTHTRILTRPGDRLPVRTPKTTLPVRAIAVVQRPATPPQQDRTRMMAAMGWSDDQLRTVFEPLAQKGHEAIWSMGDDAALAALSTLRRPLWDHCKQRFAQVTNPPIDPLRERHVMSLKVFIAGGFELPSPVITGEDLEVIQQHMLPVKRVDATFPVDAGVDGALETLRSLQAGFQEAGIVIVSDRNVSQRRAALPALLALSAIWKAMVGAGMWNVPLVIETGQVVETHHAALLIAAGATAVVPYLALEHAARLGDHGGLAYRSALDDGLRKVVARMGISTIASYRNSQLFETVGLDRHVCESYFEDAHHVPGGKSHRDILEDSLEHHKRAYGDKSPLRDQGLYRFRHNGEQHANSPELVRRLHRFIKSPGEQTYRSFAELSESREAVTIRDLLELAPGKPRPIEEVESQARILSRFSTQAMSLGAVSRETHRTLAIAMNRMGAKSNTGEGGEDPNIYGGDPAANNRIKQVASARFGVTTEYLVNADELEIKIAQGAKPGEGGQLPAVKVTPYIAKLRHAIPGMTLISPPPHHDIYSIEDLAQLVYDLREVNPAARIGVKLVSGAGVGIVAAGVAKAGADVITIAGHDGGTGASPLTSIRNTGLPWEIGLRDAHCTLLKAGLRDRVRLRVDGGLKFGRDVVIAALLGADEFGFGTAALLAIGCVMARQCHLNTCPVGIATQNESLRARFTGRPEMVEAYFRALADEVRELLVRIGATAIDQIVGQSERLRPRDHKAQRFIEHLLKPAPDELQNSGRKTASPRPKHTDWSIKTFRASAEEPQRLSINTEDRAVGARLSGDLLRCGKPGTTETLRYEFTGTAGQSFGAFLTKGLEFKLHGEANDYVGKGLSGGTIIISAGAQASSRGDVLAGNTALYGATSGELYLAGRVGERFAVRNSGALAVVEGVGHHACEYMTAGIVVVLGPSGPNFGAGMTGGLAYVLQTRLLDFYNRQSVSAEVLHIWEESWLREVLTWHWRQTGSPRAAKLLIAGEGVPFVRVQPLQPPCSIQQTWSAFRSNIPQSVPFQSVAFDPAPATT